MSTDKCNLLEYNLFTANRVKGNVQARPTTITQYKYKQRTKSMGEDVNLSLVCFSVL